MNKIIIMLFALILTGCVHAMPYQEKIHKKFTYQEYFEYAYAFFWQNNDSATIGDDNIFASKMATDLYIKQVDLDKLTKEMHDNDASIQVMNSFTYTKDLREWFVVNKSMGYGCQVMGSGKYAVGGGQEYKIDDVNRYIEAYLLDDIEILNKKWKGEMPDYLEKAYQNNKHIVINR